MFLTVSQFAEKRNVTGRYVRKLIQTGKITENSWKMKGKQYRIDPAKAEKDLHDNLDRIYNPGRPSDDIERYLAEPMENILPAYDDQSSRLEIQEQAADIASEGEEPFPGGYTHPWPYSICHLTAWT